MRARQYLGNDDALSGQVGYVPLYSTHLVFAGRALSRPSHCTAESERLSHTHIRAPKKLRYRQQVALPRRGHTLLVARIVGSQEPSCVRGHLRESPPGREKLGAV